jgi:hypothetical protein
MIGRVFRLRVPLLAIVTQGGKRVNVTIPQDAVVKVLSDGGPFVNALWDGKIVAMFAVDLQERGDRVESTR